MLAIYEVAPINDPNGSEIQFQIQNDWGIFSYGDPETVRKFLSSVFPAGHALLGTGVVVRLHFGETGVNADHRVTWSLFSEEIRTLNRYFPETHLDLKILREALEGSVENIPRNTLLYRARLFVEGEVFRRSTMGAPPVHKAIAGRANPVGIPYLYLTLDEPTSIYETRIANHTRVVVGKFRTVNDLKILNLATIEYPDYFSVENPTTAVVFFKLLQRMGEELKKPVRSSDQSTDYIPTQYLCELAKSCGLDGVMYSSSLDPGGRNVVLFDVHAAKCKGKIKTVTITSLRADWTNEF